MSDPPGKSDRTHEFVRLLSQCERRLYTYILSLAPNFSDADDIAQSARLKLWEQLDQYDASRDFGAWACTVAYYEFLTWREKKQRDRHQFSQQFVEAVSEEISQQTDLQTRRQEKLSDCVQELDSAGQQLLKQTYDSQQSIKQIAASLGRSLDATYQQIFRIRRRLRDCIERKLAEEESR